MILLPPLVLSDFLELVSAFFHSRMNQIVDLATTKGFRSPKKHGESHYPHMEKEHKDLPHIYQKNIWMISKTFGRVFCGLIRKEHPKKNHYTSSQT